VPPVLLRLRRTFRHGCSGSAECWIQHGLPSRGRSQCLEEGRRGACLSRRSVMSFCGRALSLFLTQGRSQEQKSADSFDGQRPGFHLSRPAKAGSALFAFRKSGAPSRCPRRARSRRSRLLVSDVRSPINSRYAGSRHEGRLWVELGCSGHRNSAAVSEPPARRSAPWRRSPVPPTGPAARATEVTLSR
jgi:hypothetical protein